MLSWVVAEHGGFKKIREVVRTTVAACNQRNNRVIKPFNCLIDHLGRLTQF